MHQEPQPATGFAAVIARHPIPFFIFGMLFAVTLLGLAWFAVASGIRYLADESLPSADLLSNSSALTAAIIGTAVACASAFVAMMLAASATNIAEASLQESRLSNKLNSPDYALMKQGYGRLIELAYLNDTSIFSYNGLNQHFSKHPELVFQADGALLERIETLLVSPEFTQLLTQCARFKDASGDADDGETSAVILLHKAIAGLLTATKIARTQKQLESYYAGLMVPMSVLLRQIAAVQWPQLQEDSADQVKTVKNAALLASLKSYPLVRFLVEDRVSMPTWSYDPTVTESVSRQYEVGAFAPQQRITMAMFPRQAGAIYADLAAPGSLLARAAVFSQLLAEALGRSVADSMLVRASVGDVYVREHLIDKAQREAEALGYSVVLQDFISRDSLVETSFAEQVKKLKAAGKTPYVIYVYDAVKQVDLMVREETRKTVAQAHIDGLYIFDNLTLEGSVQASEPEGHWDLETTAKMVADPPEFPDNSEIFRSMRQSNLEQGQTWLQQTHGRGMEDSLAASVESELKRREAVQSFVRRSCQVTPGAIGFIGIHYVEPGDRTAYQRGTIGALLDEQHGAFAGQSFAGDLAGVLGQPDPALTDAQFLEAAKKTRSVAAG